LRPRFARAGLFVAGGAAYGDVMPYCQTVVHHGGAGATDAALEAGVPNLMIAHAHHQRVHAALAEARGVARALRPGVLTADSMAAELDALSDARFSARARALKTARASEQAASALVSAIAAV
jgi:UDP:flavonoid glycosyltransferase YjiC (YdhE family)